MAITAARLQVDVDANTRGAERDLNRMDGVVSRSARTMAGAFFKATKVAAYGLGIAGTAVAGLGIKTAASMEQSEIAFETLLGSTKRAKDFLGDLTDFAAKTPFEFPGLVDASRQLIGVGHAAEDVIPTLTAFGDMSGALGLSQEQFQRVMVATTQSMAKGKFQAEELMQMTEAGVPIWPMLAEAMGKTVPQIQKLASEGKLLAGDVLPLLEAQMSKDYGGAMERQSTTLTGLWSTFMDTVSMGAAEVLQPLMPLLKQGVSGAVENLAGWFETGKDWANRFVEGLAAIADWWDTTGPQLRSMAEDVMGAVGDTFEEVSGFVSNLIDLAEAGQWEQLGETIGQAISSALSSLSDMAGELYDMFIKWFRSVDWMGIGIEVGKMAVPLLIGLAAGLINFDLGAVLSGLGEHWQEILLAVLTIAFMPAKIIGKIAGLLRKIPFVGRLIAWGLEAISKFGKSILGAIGKALQAFGTGFMNAIGRTGPGIFARFRQVLMDLPTWLQLWGGELARRALAAITKMGAWVGRHGPKQIVGALRAVKARMLGYFSDAAGWLVSKGTAILKGLLNGIKAGFGAVSGWVKGIGGRVAGAIGSVASSLKQKGIDLIAGFLNGIKAKAGEIISTIKAYVTDKIPAFIKQAFGMRSPSKLMAKLGAFISQGLAVGIRKGGSHALDTVKAFVEAVKEQFEGGSQVVTRLAEAYGRKMARYITGLEKTQQRLKALKEEAAQFASGVADSFRGGAFGGGEEGTTLAGRLRERVKAATQFRSNLTKLIRMGMSPDLVRQLAEAGPEALADAMAAVQSGRGGVAELNKLNRKLNRVSGHIGGAASQGVYGDRISGLEGRVREFRQDIRDNIIQVNLPKDWEGDPQALVDALRKWARRNGRADPFAA